MTKVKKKREKYSLPEKYFFTRLFTHSLLPTTKQWTMFYLEKWPDSLCYIHVWSTLVTCLGHGVGACDPLPLKFNPASKMSKKQTSLENFFGKGKRPSEETG